MSDFEKHLKSNDKLNKEQLGKIVAGYLNYPNYAFPKSTFVNYGPIGPA